MRTRELAEVAPRSADHSEDLAVESNFKNAPRVGRLADEQYLIGSRSDAHRVGRSDHSLEAFASGCGAIRGMRRWIRRHIDREHAFEIALGVKHLDAMVRAIANVDVILAIDRDRVGNIKLPGTGPLRSP